MVPQSALATLSTCFRVRSHMPDFRHSSAASHSCLSQSCSVNTSARAALVWQPSAYLLRACFLTPVSRGVAAFSFHARCSGLSHCAPPPVRHQCRRDPPLGIAGSNSLLDSPLHLLLSRGCACTVVLRVVHLPFLLPPYRTAGLSCLPTQTLVLKGTVA
jgi:hypothetical protein